VTQNVENGEGVLVITVWHEPGAQPAFRARIVSGPTDEPGPVSAVANDPADVMTLVENWLAEIAE
jgi:hypothetical protein